MKTKDDNFQNQTLNVIYKEELNPETLIYKISRRLNKKVRIKEIEAYVGDQTHLTGSNSRLLSLGWKPAFDLEKDIDEFVKVLE